MCELDLIHTVAPFRLDSGDEAILSRLQPEQFRGYPEVTTYEIEPGRYKFSAGSVLYYLILAGLGARGPQPDFIAPSIAMPYIEAGWNKLTAQGGNLTTLRTLSTEILKTTDLSVRIYHALKAVSGDAPKSYAFTELKPEEIDTSRWIARAIQKHEAFSQEGYPVPNLDIDLAGTPTYTLLRSIWS